MNNILTKYPRILAIAPEHRGFGYALIEGHKVLAGCGMKWIGGEKNAGCIKKAEKMIAHYNPQVLVLENTRIKGSHRSQRIKVLTKRLLGVAEKRNVKVVLFSQKEIRRAFLGDKRGTKHAVAEIIAEEFPEELSFRLPPKRRTWMSEDPRLAMFDAVALALVYFRSGVLRRSESLAPSS
jgi:Holliday junction resolvasome RuvABC endonuclease subunit